MKQYCRYCAHCVYGDAIYCSKKDITMSEQEAKRMNKCKDFSFCKIDVFNPEHIYKERKISELAKNQIKFKW